MKIDAPSQILNVTNTTSQYHRHQLRQKIYNVRQTNHQTPSTPTKTPVRQKNTRYAKQNKYTNQNKHTNQNTKYVNLYSKILIYVVLSRIYALFWRTFYRPKKYGGVPKMTIIRYGEKVVYHQMRGAGKSPLTGLPGVRAIIYSLAQQQILLVSPGTLSIEQVRH